MRSLYLIPARGGSKGVPGKNIRMLAGLPLIAHSIGHALGVASQPEDVIVSTDSEEIARVAREAGASLPFMRPAELATDTAGSREVMLHAVDFMNALPRNAADPYDTIVLLQPTSPLRDAADIARAIDIFGRALSRGENPDMVVSVSPARTNPYYNGFETDSSGFLRISKGDGRYTRRQDAPEVWEFNGAIYVISVDALRRSVISRFERTIPMPIDPMTAVDIDSETDFLICENLWKRLHNNRATD